MIKATSGIKRFIDQISLILSQVFHVGLYIFATGILELWNEANNAQL